MRRLVTGMAKMIRVDQIWLSMNPLDMRAGTDTLLARVVATFGEARPHQAYLFANRSATRMKVLVHDGIGIWLAARRLNQGRFIWPKGETTATLTRQQFDALILGLPWERLSDGGIIRLL
jgi:transposase